MAIITTIFGGLVIVISLLSNAMTQSSDFSKPEIDAWVLEDVSPIIEQSYVEELRERSQNSVGIELEL